MAELSDTSCESLELRLVLVVYLLHLFLHMREVRCHVALHTLSQGLVNVVHRSQIPLVVTSLYFYETVVVTGLLDGVVHGKQIVEVDVGYLLGKSVLSQTNQLFHSFHIVRMTTELLQSLLAEVQSDVHVLRVVDVVRGVVDVVRGVVVDDLGGV